MKNIVVIGAGGFGREAAQLIKDINKEKAEWNFLGYIDECVDKHGTVLNNDAVLGGFDWFERNSGLDIWAVCAVGNSKTKYLLTKKAALYGVKFANLIHPNVVMNEYIDMGEGIIVCANSFLSVNVKIGNHVAINPGCGIGHDTIIEDFCTLMWYTTLAGNVFIGEGSEIGSNATVIQQKVIGSWSIIGAGAVVTRDIPPKCTAVGVPAKPINSGNNIV